MNNKTPPATLPANESPTFDVAEFVFFALGRFRYYIAIFAAVGLVYGVAQALKLPNTYRSEGQFLVRAGERESRTPDTSLERGDSRNVKTPGVWEEIHLLDTIVLYQRLAEDLGAERVAKRYDPKFRDTENTPFLTRLQHDLQVRFWFPTPPQPEDEDEGELEAGAESEETDPAVAVVEDAEEEVDPNAFRTVTPIEAAAQVAMARTTFEPLKMGRSADSSSRVITIRYEAFSPELAQDVVRKLMELCVARHRELFAAQYQGSFISKQLEEALGEEEDAREDYFEHVDLCGFFDIPEQKRTLVQNIERTQRLVDETSIQRRVAQDDLDHVSTDLDELVPSSIVSPTVNNPLIADLLRRWHAKRSEILAIPYAEGTTAYLAKRKKLDKELADIEGFIEEQTPSYELEGGTEDPLGQSLINDAFKKLVVKERELKSRLRRYDIEIEDNTKLVVSDRERLTALLACEPQHETLTRVQRKALVRADKLTGAKDDAEVFDLMDQDEQMSNLIFVQDATYNPIKLGPSRSRSVIMGLFGGIALGVVFAFLRQILDSKLRFPGNIERTLGLRVLGVIPEQGRWRRLGRRIRKAG